VLLGLLAAGCTRDSGGGADSPVAIRDERMKMGTRFEIQVVTGSPARGRRAIEAAYAEIDRLEALLSEWRETSEISELNRNAGHGPFHVGPELYEVLDRSVGVSRTTEGAFDVTFAACGALWSFRDRRVPADAEIDSCLGQVGFERVVLDPNFSTVELPGPAMRVGIAGIGKGYGVDRAVEVLVDHGIDRYIVDGGGDVRVAGANVDRPWRVGIADPRRRGEGYGAVELDRGAIVTSGDYERFFEVDGVRYHHILDPRTGRPASGTAAVTVIATEATEADALATGLFVLGPDRGLALAESLAGVEALFIDAEMVVRRTSGFPEPLAQGRAGAEPGQPTEAIPNPG